MKESPYLMEQWDGGVLYYPSSECRKKPIKPDDSLLRLIFDLGSKGTTLAELHVAILAAGLRGYVTAEMLATKVCKKGYCLTDKGGRFYIS